MPMSDSWSDARIAARTLTRARGFTGAVMTILALAIAFQTSVLAVVNAYLVRSLPYPAANRLFTVSYARPGEAQPPGLADLDWDAVVDVVEHPIAWDLDVFYLRGDVHPEAVRGAWVTPGFMRGLGIRPALGRAFAPEEFAPGAPQVALIGHELWRNRFGGDTAVLGRRFEAYVSDRPDDPEVFTIVGVLPPGFWHVNPYTSVLTPLRAATYPYYVTLREGIPPALAERRIADLVRTGGAALPTDWRVELRSVHAAYASSVKPMLLAVGASVFLVLLIACANVAFLVLIRGMRRRKEMAVRLALGAETSRVARLLATESLLLAGAAALAGMLLAVGMLRQFGPAIERQLGRPVPGGTSALSIDLGVAVAVGALATLIAVGLTLAQLAVTSRLTLFSMMRRRMQSGAEGAGGRRTRSSLIVLEIAGSLALLVGSGLMLRTVVEMLVVDLGLQPAGVVSSGVALRERNYPDAELQAGFYERLLLAQRDRPGVTAAAFGTPGPLTEPNPRVIRADDASEAAETLAGVFVITPDYFGVMGMSMVRGRGFTDRDRAGGEPVAILSESAARRLWPDGSAIGRRVRVGDGPATMGVQASTVSRTVVGVVRDVRQSPTDERMVDAYLPLLQVGGRFANLFIKGPGAPEWWAGELRSTLRAIDPEVSLANVGHLDAVAADQLARPRFLASLFTGFGVFALMLACIGVYGVIAYAVRQREHEIAIRMAVGADGGAIMRLFAREGGVLLAVGIGVGAAGAFGIGRVLESQLYGVAAVDPWTIAVASLALTAACGMAIWWPARQASGIDPATALRAE
ncbi:MAG TPA: ADOP family duplicated permease [Gemmatimonadaceae bacterium]|nr:ADOP family duplicated permease [Gemmatimonadaceae bacterium]